MKENERVRYWRWELFERVLLSFKLTEIDLSNSSMACHNSKLLGRREQVCTILKFAPKFRFHSAYNSSSYTTRQCY